MASSHDGTYPCDLLQGLVVGSSPRDWSPHVLNFNFDVHGLLMQIHIPAVSARELIDLNI